MTEDLWETRSGSGGWDANGSHLPAWEKLYREHYRSAISSAFMDGADMATAQDVAQDAFIVLQKALLGSLQEEAALKYLRTTIKHMVIKQAVRRRREWQVSWGVLDQIGLPPVASAEKEALIQEESSALAEVVQKLPRRQREVLSLAMLEHSPAEIAAVLGINANAVRVHLHHARARVRALLRSELVAS